MRIRNFRQVAIKADDLDAAVSFYQQNWVRR
jgi:hypothetical protein